MNERFLRERITQLPASSWRTDGGSTTHCEIELNGPYYEAIRPSGKDEYSLRVSGDVELKIEEIGRATSLLKANYQTVLREGWGAGWVLESVVVARGVIQFYFLETHERFRSFSELKITDSTDICISGINEICRIRCRDGCPYITERIGDHRSREIVIVGLSSGRGMAYIRDYDT